MRILRPNPLIYPARHKPGFDPTHPVANSVRLSAVASGSNFVNLLSGKAGTISGTPVSAISGVIGPSTNIGAGVSSDRVTFSGMPIASSAMTMAAIMIGAVPGGTNPAIFSNTSSSSSGYIFYQNNGTGILTIQQWGIGSNSFSTVIPVPGHPCFVAATKDANGSFFVSTDLITGAIQSNSAGGGSVSGTPNGTYTIGNWPAANLDDPRLTPMSAVMYSDVVTSSQLLLQWAQDPWAFWYPRRSLSIVGAAAAAAIKAQMLALMGIG